MKGQNDYSQYAQVPNLQAYQSKPVQNYGMSLLQSMGFTPERGIGHNKKNALSEPLVLKPRPRGLGLGAQQENQQKKPLFQKGAYVTIAKSPHDGLVGVVVEVREDEITVELLKSHSVVKVLSGEVKAISKEEAREEMRERGREEQSKKKKRLKWAVPSIRVKVVDKKSKYYLKKVIISQVLNDRDFECIYHDNQGQKIYLKDLREKDIQTVVPKAGGEVLVVRGTHLGERGKVLKVQKQSQRVIVQTESQLQLITVEEDDVCEYIDL